MIHGTKDTDVPHELSAAMAEELASHQVAHKLISVPEAGHGLAQGDPDLVRDAHDRGLAFIRQHLQ
jgi:dipeptidyl aminopeptidase/acylaminoacyl peptidase